MHVEFQIDLPERLGGQLIHVECEARPRLAATLEDPGADPYIEDLLVTDDQGTEVQMTPDLTTYITDMALSEAAEQDMLGMEDHDG